MLKQETISKAEVMELFNQYNKRLKKEMSKKIIITPNTDAMGVFN